MGTTTTLLTINTDDAGRTMYYILEETESLGGNCVFDSDDPDALACWIIHMIQDKNT